MIRIAARLRFTIAVSTILLATQVIAADPVEHRRLVREFGTTWDLLTGGQVWRLATAIMVEDQPGIRWSIIVPFIWVGVAEWYLGWRRTCTVFFLTDWLSTIAILVVLRIAANHSSWSAAEIAMLDCGTSAAIYGTIAAFCSSRRGPNAWIGPTLVAQSLVTIWLTNRRLFDVQHLGAAAVGIAFGLWFGRHPFRRRAIADSTSGALDGVLR